MAIDYISNLRRAEYLCDQFVKRIAKIFLNEGNREDKHIPSLVWLKPYQQRFRPIKACIELCRILKMQSLGELESSFFEAASFLDSLMETPSIESLKSHISMVKVGFSSMRNELSAICSAFDVEEKERMNEAIHNYFEGCNYSCVAMSVSAVESRLLRLMCLVSPDSRLELEKKTLGQLIWEYVNNKDNYKNVVSEKHEPLLGLCNIYRTFSVHPKKQRITGRLATSILNLALEFLTDGATRPEVVEGQLIASQGSN